MDKVFITILTGIFIAGITSLITVHLSINKFRTEKWWERKADAYTQLLDALHNAKKFSDEHLRATYKSKDVSDERDEELRKLSRESREEIFRALDVGSFLFCEEAVDTLKSYEREIDELYTYETWFDYIDADNTINHRTLAALIPIARKDLNQ